MEPGSAGCRKGKVSGHSWTGPSRLRKARVGLAGGHTGCLGQMGPPKRTPALSECLGSPPPQLSKSGKDLGPGYQACSRGGCEAEASGWRPGKRLTC